MKKTSQNSHIIDDSSEEINILREHCQNQDQFQQETLEHCWRNEFQISIAERSIKNQIEDVRDSVYQAFFVVCACLGSCILIGSFL